jgi:hypothetical protein
MDKPEADKLILKMEDRKNVVLYKRKDGKFLTSNCPVGVRTKMMNIVALVLGLVLFATAAVVFVSLPQPSSVETKEVELQPATQSTAGSDTSSSKNPMKASDDEASSDGWENLSEGGSSKTKASNKTQTGTKQPGAGSKTDDPNEGAAPPGGATLESIQQWKH